MITLIAACDPNNVIGIDDKIPWYIPDDFKHFKNTTLNHPIIMGRKTWESLPKKPLPNRTNIVISSKPVEGADHHFTDVIDTLEFAKNISNEIFIIGGQTIYEQTIEFADRLLISRVLEKYDGNVFFPKIDPKRWELVLCDPRAGFKLLDYRRRL